MSIYNIESDLDSETNPFFGLLVLLGSLFIVNYFAIKGGSSSGSSLLAIFLLLLAVLYFINPVYSFVFCLALHVDLISCFNYNWVKFMTFAGMYLVFVKNASSLFLLFEDKKLKALFFLGFIFGLYIVLISIGLKSTLSTENILGNFGFMFGFLTILPAYYLTLRYPKKLFISLSLVAASFLVVYFLDIMLGFGLFELGNYERGTGASIDRLAGYDIRQSVIFFTYLIPAVALAANIKNIYKYFLMFIGIFSYIVLILAFYRLAMFYVAMGTILSFVFIRRYADTRNIIKYIVLFIIFLFVAGFFFGDYLTEIQNLFTATVDYFSGKSQDSSADARFAYQLPILTGFINDNWWTGIGIVDIKGMQEFGMFGFVDFPLLGTMAAFGFLGMFLYYLKFIFLLSGNRKHRYDMSIPVINEYPFVLYLCLTLKAYLISMITFRMIYISWELTFDFQQAEFGLLAGGFLALERMIKESNYENKEFSEN
ncbi:MAG: hypothetical protein ABI760_09830 [Ferruginibacter sp.]